MIRQLLSLAMRPKTFASVIGQDKLLAQIRKHAAKSAVSAWLFFGQKGSGKTSIARIMSISYQCPHRKFGFPCIDCRRKRSEFDITEINVAKHGKKEDIESIAETGEYHPSPGSLKKIIILDEIHRGTPAAQDVLLKYVEDAPKTTVYILNTTKPQLIDSALQSRCMTYAVNGLTIDGIRELIKKGLEFIGSTKSAAPLADALIEAGITSPRLILMATEKYFAGASPEDATKVDISSDVDTYQICRNLIKGDWDSVRKALADCPSESARGIRTSVAGYLKAILLDEPEINSRTTAVANAIYDLTTIPPTEDSNQFSATIAVLYRVCVLFNRYKH
jgi:replication-associated recombination protein RarA